MGEKIKLYVGSLPFETRGPELEEMFSKYGTPYNGKYCVSCVMFIITGQKIPLL